VSCANSGGAYAPELIFTWANTVKNNLVLNYRIGRNLAIDGVTDEWSGELPAVPLAVVSSSGKKLQGSGVCASRLDRGQPLDLVFGWIENSEEGYQIRTASANNVRIMPAYVPQEKDLSTIGDRRTGLTRAAILSMANAGLYSPRDLIVHTEQYVNDPDASAKLPEMINQALDATQPPIPQQVRPELKRYLLHYYETRGE
jgi:hypothetical protein